MRQACFYNDKSNELTGMFIRAESWAANASTMARETAEEILLVRSSMSAMITIDSFPPKRHLFSLKCRWIKPSPQTSRVFAIYKSSFCDL